LILKKRLKTPSDYVVKAWGIPRRGLPEGAAAISYGPKKLSYRKLDSASRNTPCVKYITVQLPVPGSELPSKAKKEIKKNLFSLKPYNYYTAMSNPKMGLRERAVLQSLKPSLNAIWTLLQSSLKELQNGFRNSGTGYLHASLNKLKSVNKWTINDHLLFRFAHWANGQVKQAKHVLRVLGLEAQDIVEALPSRKRPGRRLDCAQLVVDKLYISGMPFRTLDSPLSRCITLGVPALTTLPLGTYSSASRNGGPEGIHRNVATRVVRTLYGKTSS